MSRCSVNNYDSPVYFHYIRLSSPWKKGSHDEQDVHLRLNYSFKKRKNIAMTLFYKFRWDDNLTSKLWLYPTQALPLHSCPSHGPHKQQCGQGPCCRTILKKCLCYGLKTEHQGLTADGIRCRLSKVQPAKSITALQLNVCSFNKDLFIIYTVLVFLHSISVVFLT